MAPFFHLIENRHIGGIILYDGLTVGNTGIDIFSDECLVPELNAAQTGTDFKNIGKRCNLQILLSPLCLVAEKTVDAGHKRMTLPAHFLEKMSEIRHDCGFTVENRRLPV